MLLMLLIKAAKGGVNGTGTGENGGCQYQLSKGLVVMMPLVDT